MDMAMSHLNEASDLRANGSQPAQGKTDAKSRWRGAGLGVVPTKASSNRSPAASPSRSRPRSASPARSRPGSPSPPRSFSPGTSGGGGFGFAQAGNMMLMVAKQQQARRRRSSIVRPATAGAIEHDFSNVDQGGIRIETMEDLKTYMEKKLEELEQSHNDQADALNKLLSEEKTAFKQHCKRALSTINKECDDDQGQWGRLVNVQKMRMERLGQHQKQALVELDSRHREETRKVKRMLEKQLEAHQSATEADQRQKAIVKILKFFSGEDFKKFTDPPEIEYQHLFKDIMNEYWKRQEKKKTDEATDRHLSILGASMEQAFARNLGDLDAPLSVPSSPKQPDGAPEFKRAHSAPRRPSVQVSPSLLGGRLLQAAADTKEMETSRAQSVGKPNTTNTSPRLSPDFLDRINNVSTAISMIRGMRPPSGQNPGRVSPTPELSSEGQHFSLHHQQSSPPSLSGRSDPGTILPNTPKRASTWEPDYSNPNEEGPRATGEDAKYFGFSGGSASMNPSAVDSSHVDQAEDSPNKDQIAPPPGVTLGLIKRPSTDKSEGPLAKPKSAAYLQAHMAMAQASGHVPNQNELSAELHARKYMSRSFWQACSAFRGPQPQQTQPPPSLQGMRAQSGRSFNSWNTSQSQGSTNPFLGLPWQKGFPQGGVQMSQPVGNSQQIRMLGGSQCSAPSVGQGSFPPNGMQNLSQLMGNPQIGGVQGGSQYSAPNVGMQDSSIISVSSFHSAGNGNLYSQYPRWQACSMMGNGAQANSQTINGIHPSAFRPQGMNMNNMNMTGGQAGPQAMGFAAGQPVVHPGMPFGRPIIQIDPQGNFPGKAVSQFQPIEQNANLKSSQDDEKASLDIPESKDHGNVAQLKIKVTPTSSAGGNKVEKKTEEEMHSIDLVTVPQNHSEALPDATNSGDCENSICATAKDFEEANSLDALVNTPAKKNEVLVAAEGGSLPLDCSEQKGHKNKQDSTANMADQNKAGADSNAFVNQFEDKTDKAESDDVIVPFEKELPQRSPVSQVRKKLLSKEVRPSATASKTLVANFDRYKEHLELEAKLKNDEVVPFTHSEIAFYRDIQKQQAKQVETKESGSIIINVQAEDNTDEKSNEPLVPTKQHDDKERNSAQEVSIEDIEQGGNFNSSLESKTHEKLNEAPVSTKQSVDEERNYIQQELSIDDIEQGGPFNSSLGSLEVSRKEQTAETIVDSIVEGCTSSSSVKEESKGPDLSEHQQSELMKNEPDCSRVTESCTRKLVKGKTSGEGSLPKTHNKKSPEKTRRHSSGDKHDVSDIRSWQQSLRKQQPDGKKPWGGGSWKGSEFGVVTNPRRRSLDVTQNIYCPGVAVKKSPSANLGCLERRSSFRRGEAIIGPNYQPTTSELSSRRSSLKELILKDIDQGNKHIGSSNNIKRENKESPPCRSAPPSPRSKHPTSSNLKTEEKKSAPSRSAPSSPASASAPGVVKQSKIEGATRRPSQELRKIKSTFEQEQDKLKLKLEVESQRQKAKIFERQMSRRNSLRAASPPRGMSPSGRRRSCGGSPTNRNADCCAGCNGSVWSQPIVEVKFPSSAEPSVHGTRDAPSVTSAPGMTLREKCKFVAKRRPSMELREIKNNFEKEQDQIKIKVEVESQRQRARVFERRMSRRNSLANSRSPLGRRQKSKKPESRPESADSSKQSSARGLDDMLRTKEVEHREVSGEGEKRQLVSVGEGPVEIDNKPLEPDNINTMPNMELENVGSTAQKKEDHTKELDNLHQDHQRQKKELEENLDSEALRQRRIIEEKRQERQKQLEERSLRSSNPTLQKLNQFNSKEQEEELVVEDPSVKVPSMFAANGWLSSDLKPIDMNDISGGRDSFKTQAERQNQSELGEMKVNRCPKENNPFLDGSDQMRGASAGSARSFQDDVSELTMLDKFGQEVKTNGMLSETANASAIIQTGYGFPNPAVAQAYADMFPCPGPMGGPFFPNQHLGFMNQNMPFFMSAPWTQQAGQSMILDPSYPSHQMFDLHGWPPEYVEHLRLQYQSLQMQQLGEETLGFGGSFGGPTMEGGPIGLSQIAGPFPRRPRRHTLQDELSRGGHSTPPLSDEEMKSCEGSDGRERRWSLQGEMPSKALFDRHHQFQSKHKSEKSQPGGLDQLLALHGNRTKPPTFHHKEANENEKSKTPETVSSVKDNISAPRAAEAADSQSSQNNKATAEAPSKRASLRDSLRASFGRASFGSFFGRMESDKWQDGPANNSRSFKNPQKFTTYTSAWLIRFLGLINIICCIFYIWWRISRTFNRVQYPFYMYSYFVAELMIIIMVWLSHISRSFPVKRPLVYMEDLVDVDRFVSECSRAAILIPVEDEKLSCVRQALFGALSQHDWMSNFHRRHQLRVVIVDVALRPVVAHLVKLTYELMRAVLDPKIQEVLILEGVETMSIKELYEFMVENRHRLITNNALELAVKIHGLVKQCDDDLEIKIRRGLKQRRKSTTPISSVMKDMPAVMFGDTKHYKEIIELPWLCYHCSKECKKLGFQSKIGKALNFTLFPIEEKSALIGQAEIIAVSPPQVCLAPEFLERTVPYFFELYGDEEKSYRWSNVGMVSCNIVAELSLPPADRFENFREAHFGIVQKGRDGTFSTLADELQNGASVWRVDALVRGFSPEGQGGKVSNKALLENQGTLVGFCTQTLAPGYHTSVRLLKKGWKSIYLHEKKERLATYVDHSKTLDEKLKSLCLCTFQRAHLLLTCGLSIFLGDKFPSQFSKFVILEDTVFTIFHGLTGFLLLVMAWLFSILGTPPISIHSNDISAFIGLFLTVMATSWLPTFFASEWRKVSIYFILRDLQALYISSFISIYSFAKAFFLIAGSKLRMTWWNKLKKVNINSNTEILTIRIFYYLLMICPLISISIAFRNLTTVKSEFNLILGYLAGMICCCLSFVLFGSFAFQRYDFCSAVVEDVLIAVFICTIVVLFILSQI